MLKSFQSIVKFVEDLSTEFGNKQHSLVLYNRLVSKTKITHQDAVKRHLQAFHEFVTKNGEAIIEKNISKLRNPIIFYSNKVNIKTDEIFKMADKQTTEVIWKHLLVIMNSLDPNTKALNVLKKSLEEKTHESEFLSSLVSKIENTVDPSTTDPMSAIMGLMSNGVFTDVISSMNSGMQNGTLDMGKLFNTVQGMMTSLGGMNMGGPNQATSSSPPVVESSNVSVSPSLPTIVESNEDSTD